VSEFQPISKVWHSQSLGPSSRVFEWQKHLWHLTATTSFGSPATKSPHPRSTSRSKSWWVRWLVMTTPIFSRFCVICHTLWIYILHSHMPMNLGRIPFMCLFQAAWSPNHPNSNSHTSARGFGEYSPLLSDCRMPSMWAIEFAIHITLCSTVVLGRCKNQDIPRLRRVSYASRPWFTPVVVVSWSIVHGKIHGPLSIAAALFRESWCLPTSTVSSGA